MCVSDTDVHIQWQNTLLLFAVKDFEKKILSLLLLLGDLEKSNCSMPKHILILPLSV